jgi:hypothetical protein
VRICRGQEEACDVKPSTAVLTVDFKSNTVRVFGTDALEPIAVRRYENLQSLDDIHYIALGSGARVITFGQPVRNASPWMLAAMFTAVYGADVYTQFMTCEAQEP